MELLTCPYWSLSDLQEHETNKCLCLSRNGGVVCGGNSELKPYERGIVKYLPSSLMEHKVGVRMPFSFFGLFHGHG